MPSRAIFPQAKVLPEWTWDSNQTAWLYIWPWADTGRAECVPVAVERIGERQILSPTPRGRGSLTLVPPLGGGDQICRSQTLSTATGPQKRPRFQELGGSRWLLVKIGCHLLTQIIELNCWMELVLVPNHQNKDPHQWQISIFCQLILFDPNQS